MGYQDLWAAVIERAILDACQPGVYQRPAVQWLFGSGSERVFHYVDLQPEAVRTTLLTDARYLPLQRAYHTICSQTEPASTASLRLPTVRLEHSPIDWLRVGDAAKLLQTSAQYLTLIAQVYRIPTYRRGKLKLIAAGVVQMVHAMPRPLPSARALRANLTLTLTQNSSETHSTDE